MNDDKEYLPPLALESFKDWIQNDPRTVLKAYEALVRSRCRKSTIAELEAVLFGYYAGRDSRRPE